MTCRLLILPILFILLVPGTLEAASVQGGRTLTVRESPPDNTYLGGAQITVAASIPADLSAAGAIVTVQAPVTGDVLILGGTILIEAPVTEDVRAVGARVTLSADAGGEVFLAGGTVSSSGHAKSLYAAGSRVDVSGSADQDVTLYGADVTLSGEYGGDVTVTASNSFTLLEGTHIRGSLRYNAPEQVSLPEGVYVDGGASYIGSYSHLPTKEEAHWYALAGIGIFIIVRALAGMIVAGLLTGLFPAFTNAVTALAITRRPRRPVLLALLGLVLLVLTPLLILLFFISFVGIGIAFLLIALYALLVLLAYACTGIIVGAVLRRVLLHRIGGVRTFSWRDAVLGTLLLSLVSLIPTIGFLIVCLLMLLSAGAIAVLAYRFAFPPDTDYD